MWTSLGVEPTERQVRLPALGTMLRVQEIGDGPVVVFVHGGSAAGSNWAPIVPYLDGVRCVVVDRPGCGLSEPHDLDVSDLAPFAVYADGLIPDILDGLGIDRAPIVATSLGGHFALRAAAHHSDRIERLIEFGYVPGAPIQHVPLSMRAATLPGLRRVMMAIPPTRGAVRTILRQLGLGPALADGRVSPEFLDWFVALLRHTPTLRNESRLPAELLAKAGTTAPALPDAVLADVECPVRFVWGEADPFGGADVARDFVARIPGAELELWPDASHAPWVDDPAGAAALIRP